MFISALSVCNQVIFTMNNNAICNLKPYSLLQMYQKTRRHIPERITVLSGLSWY
jgi:hypothetical protein